jgi:hypothetical protein
VPGGRTTWGLAALGSLTMFALLIGRRRSRRT